MIIENENKIRNIENIINNDNKKKENIIKGIIEIENKDVLLFNEYHMKINEGIDVYLNNEKINTNIIKYNNKKGKYEFNVSRM